MSVKSYRDLLVWHKAMDLVDAVYIQTNSFPKEELYGLTNQMRRAAVSIPSNLSEGSVRSRKEFVRFIDIARGSLAELETQLLISQRREFIPKNECNRLLENTNEISKMLMGLSKSLQSQGTNH